MKVGSWPWAAIRDRDQHKYKAIRNLHSVDGGTSVERSRCHCEQPFPPL